MAVYQDASDTGLRGPVPRDARLIALILSSMGVSDVEPAVLLQLLEFAHRYTYDVLSDALVYSDHANSRQAGSNLSLDDVNLAIQSRVNYSFTKPPEKDMLLGLASTVNAIPLPPISDRHGVRLPPPQHCLTNVNFGIVPNPPPEDFDDFEAEPAPTTTSTAAAAGGADVGVGAAGGGASQQTVGPSTQNSSLFDSHSQPPAPRTTEREQDDYDNDDDDAADDDDGDVSMTTVHPSQSQSQSQPQDSQHPQSTPTVPPSNASDNNAHRGIKRSLDEDQEYD